MILHAPSLLVGTSPAVPVIPLRRTNPEFGKRMLPIAGANHQMSEALFL